MDVKQKANQLIYQYKTDNPFKVAQFKNIRIIYADLGGKLGNYLKYRRSKFIIIDNIRTPTNMHSFICAHELGHAICTPDDNTEWLKAYTMKINADKIEYIANHFAVEFLLNDEYIHRNKECNIFQLAQLKGIPRDMIKLKEF